MQVSAVALEHEATPLLIALHLGRLSLESLLHVSHLPLVDLLHLAVLVPNDRDVFLGEARLLAELFLEGERLIDVVLTRLRLGLQRGQGGSADLLAHREVLLPNLLELFLLATLFELVGSQTVHVVFHHLLVEDFGFVDLLQQALHSLRVLQVARSLVLFELRLLVPQLHQNALVLGALGLNLAVQKVVFGLYLTHLLVWQVHCAQHVWVRQG